MMTLLRTRHGWLKMITEELRHDGSRTGLCSCGKSQGIGKPSNETGEKASEKEAEESRLKLNHIRRSD